MSCTKNKRKTKKHDRTQPERQHLHYSINAKVTRREKRKRQQIGIQRVSPIAGAERHPGMEWLQTGPGATQERRLCQLHEFQP